MKKTKKGFVSTIVGISISLINAIIQFLLIYWVLRTYGTEFNGFIRLTSAFSIVGGTTEGALGVSTVILLIKPLANRDFITANEIYSTAKTRYRKGILTKFILLTLIAFLYPLEIMIAPTLLNGQAKPIFEMGLFSDGHNFLNIPFYQLIIIVFFFGIKNIISSSVFGVYENVIQADQQNGLRRVIILFSDVLIYGIIFALLHIRIGDEPLNPTIVFSILLLYALVRGAFIMLYVKRNYKWLKYYREFNNFQLRKTTGRMFWSSIGQAILFNLDIVIVMITLGAYGLRTSSMLSLYLIVGLNTRLIMTNFITSFREYFVSVLVRNGRLEWKDYCNYELYMYAVAAFTFVIMALISPYLVNALYGDLVQTELNRLIDNQELIKNSGGISPNLNIMALQNAKEFIFQKPLFSFLYATTTALILIIQGHYTLIQAKGRVEQVSKWIDIAAGLFVGMSVIMILIFSVPQVDNMFIVNSLISYYIIKVVFMLGIVIFLWFYNFLKGTYNSNSHYTFLNLLVFLIPIVLSVLASIFILEPLYPVAYITQDGTLVSTFSDWKSLILYLLVLIPSSFLTVTLIALSIRPKVAVSLILMLPLVKQIVSKSQKNSRYKRLRAENIDLDYFNSDEDLNYAFVSLYRNNVEFSINTVINIDDVFKPKIYKIKNKNSPKKLKSKE